MWRKICAQSPVGRLEYGIKELQEVFQKIKSKPNLGRKTSHQKFWRYPTTNLSDPEDISAVRRFKKSTNLLNSDLQLQKHDQMPHVPKNSRSIPGGSFRITWNSPFHMKRKNSIQVPPPSPLSRSALVMSERAALGTWTPSSSKLKRRGVQKSTNLLNSYLQL